MDNNDKMHSVVDSKMVTKYSVEDFNAYFVESMHEQRSNIVFHALTFARSLAELL